MALYPNLAYLSAWWDLFAQGQRSLCHLGTLAFSKLPIYTSVANSLDGLCYIKPEAAFVGNPGYKTV